MYFNDYRNIWFKINALMNNNLFIKVFLYIFYQFFFFFMFRTIIKFTENNIIYVTIKFKIHFDKVEWQLFLPVWDQELGREQIVVH